MKSFKSLSLFVGAIAFTLGSASLGFAHDQNGDHRGDHGGGNNYPQPVFTTIPVYTTVSAAGQKAGQAAGQKAGQAAGQKAGQAAGQKAGQAAGQKAGQAAGQKASQAAGQKASS